MLLSGKTGKYSVDKKVAESDVFSVYVCKDIDTEEPFLLQIATETEHNGNLDRAAFVLKEMKATSDYYEEEFSKTVPNVKLNYDRLFPKVMESFISEEQGGRRINILALKDISDINQLIPLSSLRIKDHLRISLETSGWIMGRLLKLISFIHPQGISLRQLDGNNMLIDPRQHFLIVLDWSFALIHPNEVPYQYRFADISNAAKAVFLAIGGDSDFGRYPYDQEHEYPKMLWQLIYQNDADAQKTHDEYYNVVHRLFGTDFIPSKIMPI